MPGCPASMWTESATAPPPIFGGVPVPEAFDAPVRIYEALAARALADGGDDGFLEAVRWDHAHKRQEANSDTLAAWCFVKGGHDAPTKVLLPRRFFSMGRADDLIWGPVAWGACFDSLGVSHAEIRRFECGS